MRVVRCSFEKAVVDEQVKADLRTAVERVHEATIYVTELLNLEVRRHLEMGDGCPDHVFDKNKLAHAFQTIVSKGGERKPHPLFADAVKLMPPFHAVRGEGLTNALQHVSNNLVTVAINNVKVHFRKRVLQHVRLHHGVERKAHGAMTKEERTDHKLEMHRITDDICSPPGAALSSNERYHPWIREEQMRFGFGDGVAPTRACMEKHPAKFVRAMYLMSLEGEAAGKHTFSLYPLRRNMVTKFMEIDLRTLNEVLQGMRNERLGRKRKRNTDEKFTFCTVFDFRAANVRQAWRMANTVCTDGVSLHMKQYRGSKPRVLEQRRQHEDVMERRAASRREKKSGMVAEKKETPKPHKPPKPTRQRDEKLTAVPLRGMWAIDQLKHVSRERFHVVSLDPGKHELFCAVDSENASSKRGVCRHTLRERMKQLRTTQYQVEGRQGKHPLIEEGEEMLSMHNSRSPRLEAFQAYISCRRAHLQSSLEFYGRLDHRQRRWKRGIKKQQADQNMVEKLRRFKTDDRPLVLAYGSWGLSAGKTNFKGLPPCIGKGLMKTLAKSFAVVITPEHYTSKTCFKCNGLCGAHSTIHRTKLVDTGGCSTTRKYPVRGLRVCQNEECKQFMNRDRLGAFNIGRNFERLLQGKPPLRELSSQEEELNRLQCSLCEGE